MSFRHFSLALKTVSLGGILALLAVPLRGAEPDYWPTEAWRESTPEQQGLDSDQLAEVFPYVKSHDLAVHSILVVRHGMVVLDAVFYPYERSEPHDIASATKSVTALLAGAAIHEHSIESVHDPISRYGLKSPLHNAEWSRVTVEDLLTMRSGLACEAQAGEPREMLASHDWIQFVLDQPLRSPPSFLYSSSSMHLLAATVRASTHQTPLEFARSALFAPLGIKTALWPADASGLNHGWGDLLLFPRDMAKLGLLMLHDGRWENRQILPEDFARAAKQLQAKTGNNNDYGYGWWVFDGNRSGDFEAVGRGGQRISVLPRLDMIVVTTGGGFDPGAIGNLLLAAPRSDLAIPQNPGAYEKLCRLAKDAERAPVIRVPATPPETQQRFDGIYTLTSNPFALAKIGFDFGRHPAVLSLYLANGDVRRHPIGIGATPLFSPGGLVGTPTAVRANWIGLNRLIVFYDEISSINCLTFDIECSEKSARFSVTDRTSPKAKIVFQGLKD